MEDSFITQWTDARTNDRALSLIQETFGNDSKIVETEKIDDGCAKKTFRIKINNLGNFLLQIWQEPEHDLTTVESPLFPCLDIEQYIANTSFLESIGVRVPHVMASSNDKPGIAIFEFIKGKQLHRINKKDLTDKAYSDMGHLLGKMHAQTSNLPGVFTNQQKTMFDCMGRVNDLMLREIEITCRYDDYTRKNRNRILTILADLRNKALDRKIFNLVHGDAMQIIINESNEPVLIDLDGLQYFDLELDYCVLNFPHSNLTANPSFSGAYHANIKPDCDEARLRYYRICKFIGWLSYFSEIWQKSKYPNVEIPYKNTLQWLETELEQAGNMKRIRKN